MSRVPHKIGSSAFSAARSAERDEARKRRRDTREAALTALHDARGRFADHAGEVYASGAAAALGDCDRLEDIADRLVATIEALEPVFDRLDVARDLALYQGPVISRSRSGWAPDRLAVLVAEALAEDLLSGQAGAVLAAAVRYQAL